MKIIPTVFSKNKKDFMQRLHKIIYLKTDVQIDIMDGRFVKAKSIAIKDIPNLEKYTKTKFEAHLMVTHPEKYIKDLEKKGIKKIIFHIEPFLHNKEKAAKIIQECRKLKLQVMLAKNPQTPVKELDFFINLVEGFLFMGIKPGKEGQKFLPEVLKDIIEFKVKHKNTFIQIDGGVNPYMAHILAKYDVRAINSGSFISQATYPEKAIEEFEKEIEEAREHREIQFIANKIRKDIILMLHEAKSGHPAGALGMSELFAMMYFGNILNIKPHKYTKNRDYIFLSNGHTCPVLYATLAEKAFFKRAELLTLRKLNSRLQGHPHIGSVPGIENTSGPLGQGISVAVGTALALKKEGAKNAVFAICGDGELDEGQVWEALLCAAHNKLDNFTLVIDRNNIQIDGYTSNVLDLDSLKKKLEAFNFETFEVHGHNLHQIKKALKRCRGDRNFRPNAIILKTIPGRGVSFMENNPAWHGKAPNDKEALDAVHEIEGFTALYNHTSKKHLEGQR